MEEFQLLWEMAVMVMVAMVVMQLVQCLKALMAYVLMPKEIFTLQIMTITELEK